MKMNVYENLTPKELENLHNVACRAWINTVRGVSDNVVPSDYALDRGRLEAWWPMADVGRILDAAD